MFQSDGLSLDHEQFQKMKDASTIVRTKIDYYKKDLPQHKIPFYSTNDTAAILGMLANIEARAKDLEAILTDMNKLRIEIVK